MRFCGYDGGTKWRRDWGYVGYNLLFVFCFVNFNSFESESLIIFFWFDYSFVIFEQNIAKYQRRSKQFYYVDVIEPIRPRKILGPLKRKNGSFKLREP